MVRDGISAVSGTLEERLQRLTVESLRNLCRVQKVPVGAELPKRDLVRHVMRTVRRQAAEQFCAELEAQQLAEDARKGLRYAQGELTLLVDPASTRDDVRALFAPPGSSREDRHKVGFAKPTQKSIRTWCDCIESTKRGAFCAHQMALLIRCLSAELFDLDEWYGPMTAEVRSFLLEQVYRQMLRRKRR